MTGSVDSPNGLQDYLLEYWTSSATITIMVNCIANAGNYEGVYTSKPLIPIITMTANVPYQLLFGTSLLNLSNITMLIRHTEAHIGQ